MGSLLTTITELATACGMVGCSSLDEVLAGRPQQMVSVSPEQWDQLRAAYEGGAETKAFESAFANGRAFFEAKDGLRWRVPESVEWRAATLNPGDSALPVDIRVDHVFLISCKYLSKILANRSPSALFDHALRPGSDASSLNWYWQVAPKEFQRFYELSTEECEATFMPSAVIDVNRVSAKQFQAIFPAKWSTRVQDAYEELSSAVAIQSANHWQQQVSKKPEQEEMLWRLLRLGPAPYFVLGSAKSSHLRLRIATPWDWRQRYELRKLEVTPRFGGQPMVNWEAIIRERHTLVEHSVAGHVEIRWGHGRFNGVPEAKVYIDTPHDEVPGYFALT